MLHPFRTPKAVWLMRNYACSVSLSGERGLHLSSRSGLMQVLLGHPLADPRSRLSRIQHQEIPEAKR